jgi:uncharacterized SAM-binding protein YcdF (DUF218 family)
MTALKVLGGCVAASFLVAAFTPLANVLHARARVDAALQPAGAIVVLGAGVEGEGVLGENSLRRLVHGVVLYHRGLAPRILVLGAANRRGIVEAEERARLAAELRVPESALVVARGGHVTADEAALAKSLLEPQAVRRILLVTGQYHMPRARRLFEKAGFEVVAAPADELAVDVSPQGRLAALRALLTEAAARGYNRLRGRL